ncbi:cysteine dioxygenase type 1 [Cimex lectularius]|uniref:Cysteine dioxygenase n=1 Tax=Cimex lectularius TaxID=79782 RepID=A0A8I6TL37_CIMLE|nr:cysteine dioxygenase type 1 [Cimex lectularius]
MLPEMTSLSVKKPETLEELKEGLRQAFSGDKVNIEFVSDLLKSYTSNPQEWKKFAKFDRYRYTRNLIDEGNGKYNLMLLCWGEGHGSAIHDHADAHCFMKILEGKLSEVRFAWPDEKEVYIADDEYNPMKETGRTTLRTNEVCYINDSLGLHRVENPSSSEPAVSLHLYCPPFDQCHVFNQQTGHKSVAKVTFWSKYGSKPDPKIQDERAPEDN